MELLFKKMHEKALAPYAASESAAGLDLFALIEQGEITLEPLGRTTVRTGIAVQLPQGTVGIVAARSSLGIKHGITLSNGIGVIDCDYRGEILVGLINLGSEPYTIKNGDRIAQLIVTPYFTAAPVEAQQLNTTQRGAGGLGSSGR